MPTYDRIHCCAELFPLVVLLVGFRIGSQDELMFVKRDMAVLYGTITGDESDEKEEKRNKKELTRKRPNACINTVVN